MRVVHKDEQVWGLDLKPLAGDGPLLLSLVSERTHLIVLLPVVDSVVLALLFASRRCCVGVPAAHHAHISPYLRKRVEDPHQGHGGAQSAKQGKRGPDEEELGDVGVRQLFSEVG